MKTHRSRDYLGVGAEHKLLCPQGHYLWLQKLEEDKVRRGNSGAEPGTQRPGQPQHSHGQGREARLLRNYKQWQEG